VAALLWTGLRLAIRGYEYLAECGAQLQVPREDALELAEQAAGPILGCTKSKETQRYPPQELAVLIAQLGQFTPAASPTRTRLAVA